MKLSIVQWHFLSSVPQDYFSQMRSFYGRSEKQWAARWSSPPIFLILKRSTAWEGTGRTPSLGTTSLLVFHVNFNQLIFKATWGTELRILKLKENRDYCSLPQPLARRSHIRYPPPSLERPTPSLWRGQRLKPESNPDYLVSSLALPMWFFCTSVFFIEVSFRSLSHAYLVKFYFYLISF